MTRTIGYLVLVFGALAVAFGCGDSQTQPYPGASSYGGGAGESAVGSGGTGPVSPAGFVCQSGQTLCGDSCVFLESNPAHCGACDNVCPSGTSCVAGQCTCQSGLISCNGACVDTNSDPANCGACGNVCAATEVCSLGICAASCDAGLTQCGQSCVDLNTNPLHCGACNNACAGGRVCQSGLCACETGTDCNGVCVDTTSDPANCGGCGVLCAAGETCSAGSCVAATTGTGGAGGAGTVVDPPDGLPGIALNGVCYPLCENTTVGDDPENPDWGFENNYSCVIPNTPTAAGGLACVTGEEIPTVNLDGMAGVWIDGTCYLLCTTVTEPSDPESPDWGYESGTSCILPGTCTAAAQACVIGAGAPDPAELNGRAGVVVVDNDADPPVKSCVPLCTCYTDPAADPEGDDWAYEYGDSCVIPGSPTGQNQACVTGEALPDPVSVPGVVVVMSDGALECVPLCTLTTDPANDPTAPLGDGWSYEDNRSCVIPGTANAETNQPCMTGEPVPAIDNSGRDGVVIFLKDDNACDGDSTECSGTWNCIAVCDYFTSPTQDGANDDGLNDDWGWENNNECIIPGTITAANTACVTGTDCVDGTQESCPPPEPRPGIMVNGDPLENSCGWTECVPICRVVTTASDPEYPDWGWEDNNSCVIPGTDTANWLPEGDLPRGCTEWCEDHACSATELEECRQQYGYQHPPRACTWPAAQIDFLAPPALDAGRIVHGTGGPGHFQTVGAELQDPYGSAFLIRGVNNSHGWFDTCGQYMAYGALDNIAAAGANTVRVGWAFESIDPVGDVAGSEPEKAVIGTNATLLAEILHEIVRLQMIPIVAINDSTGQSSCDWPDRIAGMWLDPAYQEVLLAYEPYLLIGLANEWDPDMTSDFYGCYNTAVQTLRNAGINHTLVITGNAWGQGCNSILDNAAQLLSSDPLGNILFDIHIYTYLDYEDCRSTTGVCGSAEVVQGCLDDIAGANIPLVIGEFGHQHSSGTVEWQTIINRANANSQGFCPWLWFGDTEYRVLDMNESWEGPLSSWGNNVLPLSGSAASIFQ